MSALALVLPPVEMTVVATLDSFEDVRDIFERNFPNLWSRPLLFQTQAVRFALELAALCYLDTVSLPRYSETHAQRLPGCYLGSCTIVAFE